MHDPCTVYWDPGSVTHHTQKCVKNLHNQNHFTFRILEYSEPRHEHEAYSKPNKRPFCEMFKSYILAKLSILNF